jgi:broad specificity phosphatase PhoE
MTDSALSYEAYIVRHGETEWNAQGLLQGHTDIPLNEKGHHQATLLGDLLSSISFAAVFSSDLSRARQTAEQIVRTSPLPVVESPALRERSAGKLDGVNLTQLRELTRPFFESPHAHIKDIYFNTPWHPELESSASVFERVTQFLYSHVPVYHTHTLLVVSHGGVMRTLLDHLSFLPGERWVVDNCGFLKVRIDSQGLHLLESQGISKRSVLT